MSGLSTNYDNKILDYLWRRTALPAGPVYLALYTALPGKTGGGTEVGSGVYGYARLAVNLDTGTWAAPSNGQISNAVALTFGTPTGGTWGLLVGYAFHETATGDTPITDGVAFTQAQQTVAGTPIVFPAGAIVHGAD